MKIELERQKFLKSWQIAEKFSVSQSAKTPQISLSGILITADENNSVTLEATDIKTSVRLKAQGVNVIESGVAVIPSAMFGSMLRKSASENLILDVNPSRGLLSSGKNKTKFAVILTEEFPKIPLSSGADEICEISGSDLAKVINEGSSASSQPVDFPKYMGACLMKIKDNFISGISTDGKRLALSKVMCNSSLESDILFLAPALKDLGKMISSNYSDKEIKISADGSTVWFNVEGEEIEFSLRKIEANFPQYERILNKDVKTTLRISAQDLSTVIERIDIIAKTTPAHLMVMKLNPGENLRIYARAPEMGTTSEDVEANIEGLPLTVGFNAGYFLDGLKVLGDEDVIIEFSSDEGQTRMYKNGNEDFLYMLMPARLSPQDLIEEEE